MIDPKVLFVTGITGHSGKLFAERLAQEGFSGEIRCAVRSTSDASFLKEIPLNCALGVGNIDDPVFLDGMMRNVDVVLQIAHIKFSTKIVESAIRNKVRRAILVHTTGRYSRFKSAAEEYIRIEDDILARRGAISITALRPTMIYGSSRDQNMYRLIDYLYRHKIFPIFGSGDNLMQPVHARDLAEAYFRVLTNPDKTDNRDYNLSGKDPLRYIDLVRTVAKALGRRVLAVPVPMPLSLLGARIYSAISAKPLVSVEQVMRMNEDKAFSHEAASRDFGYAPVSFADGIKGEVAEYLRARGSPLLKTVGATE